MTLFKLPRNVEYSYSKHSFCLWNMDCTSLLISRREVKVDSMYRNRIAMSIFEFCRIFFIAKVMVYTFLSVVLFTGGRGSSWAGTPPGQVHSPAGTPPGQVHPPRQVPIQNQVHTPAGTSPQRGACWEIRATSGRYASYWNAFLLFSLELNFKIVKFTQHFKISYIFLLYLESFSVRLYETRLP